MKTYIIVCSSGFITGVIAGVFIDKHSQKKEFLDDEYIREADALDPYENEEDRTQDLNELKNMLDINAYAESRRLKNSHSSLPSIKPDIDDVEEIPDPYEGDWGDEDEVEDEDEDEPILNKGEEDFVEMRQHRENMDDMTPQVIAPEEFGELDDYDTETLFYFSDGFLTDSNYKLLPDIEDVVGYESLNSFGQYEADSVFVRNEKYKTDYEILADERQYNDVSKRVPKPHEV